MQTMQRAGGLDVFTLTEGLRRGAYVQRELLHQLSGWFMQIKLLEDKYRCGYHLWEHAEHIRMLRERLELLRGGKPDANVPPELKQAVQQSLHAPDANTFLGGLYEIMLPELQMHYEHLSVACDPSVNAYDLRILKRIRDELELQCVWYRQRKVQRKRTDAANLEYASGTIWQKELRKALNRCGGIDGKTTRHDSDSECTEPKVPFRFPERISFSPQIEERSLLSHQEKLKLPHREAVIEQFRVFFNEIYAASMLASILFEARTQEVPWAFVYDMSRQFWDEVRHSEWGAIRLRELGSEPDRCDQTLLRYSLQMPFLHRICYLTMVLEPHYMPRKKPRWDSYLNVGDLRSALFADHDWSDEGNHVRYGKKWLDFLLADDARDVDDLKREIMQIIERYSGTPVTILSPF